MPNGAKTLENELLQEQIKFLKEQIVIKDSQLEKQAYSLQSLIQVNSALNMKLLPESPVHQGEERVKEKEPEKTVLQEHVSSEILASKIEGLEPGKGYPGKKESNKTREPKTIIEKTCINCNKPFTAKNPKQRYCSGACKTAYNRKDAKENKLMH